MAENPKTLTIPNSLLLGSFDKTNLDLEHGEPLGGPINDPKSNYIHKYNGKLGKTYLDKYQGARSHNSSFGTEGTDIKPNSSFEKSNLDLERESPLGGPLNDSNSGFVHKYTPLNKYLDSKLTSKIKGTSKNENSFKTTGLDIENPKAGAKQGGTGGPNRTNSNNIPSGQYLNIGTSNMFGFYSNQNGVTLKNKSNNSVTTKLQQYTPTHTYTDLLRLTPNDEL